MYIISTTSEKYMPIKMQTEDMKLFTHVHKDT